MINLSLCSHGVVVITTVQLHSTWCELRFCVGSNLLAVYQNICDSGNLIQWSWLKVRVNAFRRSTILQIQFIIIIIIIIIIVCLNEGAMKYLILFNNTDPGLTGSNHKVVSLLGQNEFHGDFLVNSKLSPWLRQLN